MQKMDEALSNIESELSSQKKQIAELQNKPSEIHYHGPVTVVKDSSNVAVGEKSKIIVQSCQHPGTPDYVEGFLQGQEGPEDETDLGEQMEPEEGLNG
ncbi:hypothetical protein KUTeg_014595 [Tegillarca granosa]|uniref:Uncharacterized protein n=1 Tax=Tegillarca granosa TaxID=220873 RepID=A0ABQ9ERJ8_TEGGR|nr:hypothetical protein KUTeg_014595 [Tegillarca granosa]